MTIYTKKGSKLRANKVECNARKISRKKKTSKTGRHKTQSITLTDNWNVKLLKS